MVWCSGRVGDWVRHFNVENNKSFDCFIQQNLGDSDLRFQFFLADDKSAESQTKKWMKKLLFLLQTNLVIICHLVGLYKNVL